MPATPESAHVMPATPESVPGLIASVLDPPLMSMWATGIPRAAARAFAETVPLTSVLPVMAVTILCVWAAHCTSEASPVHESAPEASPVHESAPEALPVHESAPVPPEAAAVTAEPPEAAASAAEPPEEVAPTHELTVCPDTAMEAVPELTVSTATATEASALPALIWPPAMPTLPCLPVKPAPPWPLALPALPWLPALPGPRLLQDPGPLPLHGLGPPSYPLVYLRPTTLLDCCFWAPGVAPRRGDSVTPHQQREPLPKYWLLPLPLLPRLWLPVWQPYKEGHDKQTFAKSCSTVIGHYWAFFIVLICLVCVFWLWTVLCFMIVCRMPWPSPVFLFTLLPCPGYCCLLVFGPACLDHDLYNKACNRILSLLSCSSPHYRVSQFELNYWNKLTFPQHSNLLRCTSIV